ncbi:MAG: YdcF family protein [Deltaproteobacteria bacterium]|nr:YdcF family protein [Deltaproteobacteria bacterium]
MFFIKKIIEALIFPPGIVIFVFLIVAFVAVLGEKYKDSRYKEDKGKGKVAKRRMNLVIVIPSLLSAVLLYLFSIQPVSNLLLSPLQDAYPMPSSQSVAKFKPDVIAVLSSGAYNKNTLDGDSFNRLYAGFKLYKRYKIPVIVSGGYAISTVSVAKVMRNILLKIGVTKSFIITEDKSNDTLQNALYVLKICRRRGFKRIILVTSAYHMPRAIFLFNTVLRNMWNVGNIRNVGNVRNVQKMGNILIMPYPADFKTNRHYTIYSFFPNLGSLVTSIQALHEYLGYAYYFLKTKAL